MATIDFSDLDSEIFLDSVPDALVIVDKEGNIAAVNQNLEKLSGYSKEELQGRSIGFLVPLNAEKEHRLHLQEYIKNPTPIPRPMGEVKNIFLLASDASKIPVDVCLSPVKVEGEIFYIAAVRDMTKRRLMEKELRESEERLEEAQSIVQMGSWDRDVLEDKLSWSDNVYCIFGLEPHSIEPDHAVFMEGVHPDDREYVESSFKNALEGKPYDITHRIILKNGTVRYVQEHCKAVFSEDDKLIRLIGTIQDITERKLAEQELQKAHNELERRVEERTRNLQQEVVQRKEFAKNLKFSEERIRAIVDSALDGIISINDQGIVESFNPAAESLFGYSSEEVIGQNVRLLMPEPYHSEHDGYLANYRRTGEKRIIGIGREVEARHRDGSTFPIELRLSESLSDKERVFIGIIRDISERKIFETQLKQARKEAEDANMAKSGFLANMSHEIRTPMNGVFGMLELLELTTLNEKQKELVGIAHDSANALLRIIDDILDFSKIEAGQLSLENTPLDLNKVVEDVVALLDEQASAKDVKLNCTIASDLPGNLSGDSLRLRQVLINLTNNAIKFASGGEVDVNVALEEETEDHLLLRFEVSDTGVGIPVEKQEALFRPFIQQDSSTTRKFGGTGLGLSISKQLVTLMGGEIGVNSIEGQGSTFWFTVNFGKTSKVF